MWTAARFSLNTTWRSKLGFATSFRACLLVLTSWTLTLLRIFSMAFPKNELFMSLKESFSASDLAWSLSSVFRSIFRVYPDEVSVYEFVWNASLGGSCVFIQLGGVIYIIVGIDSFLIISSVRSSKHCCVALNLSLGRFFAKVSREASRKRLESMNLISIPPTF